MAEELIRDIFQKLWLETLFPPPSDRPAVCVVGSGGGWGGNGGNGQIGQTCAQGTDTSNRIKILYDKEGNEVHIRDWLSELLLIPDFPKPEPDTWGG